MADITRREWFAGQALLAMADPRDDAARMVMVCKKAYIYADQMIAEGKKYNG